MSFRDFVDSRKTNRMEVAKKDELRMNSVKKIAKPAIRMSGARRRQVEQRDAYEEAEEMLDTLNEKLRQVLYRFGMSGLELVDRAIIETCREMMNPSAVAQTTARVAKKRAVVAESSLMKHSQPVQTRQPASFIDLAAAAVQKMTPMGDMSEHLPESADAPIQDAQAVNNVALPVTQPDAGVDYYDKLDPSTLDPDELEAMLNGKNTGDAGIAMNADVLAAAGQALQKGK